MAERSASSASLAEMIEALRCLPGVGPKSAQRIAYHLLQRDRAGGARLAKALDQALRAVRHCRRCNTFTEAELCTLCANPGRDAHLLCVVETPADQLMIEQTLMYKGLFFVLMGHISPLEGIGPRDLHFDQLAQRAADGVVTEVIVASNFTNEGEATAHYVTELLKRLPLRITRLARGVPVGGELEYVDAGTIAQALLDRRPMRAGES